MNAILYFKRINLSAFMVTEPIIPLLCPLLMRFLNICLLLDIIIERIRYVHSSSFPAVINMIFYFLSFSFSPSAWI